MPFERIFEGRTRSEMVGLFLALLELIRQDRVRIEQAEQFGQITVHMINETPITEVLDSDQEATFKDYQTPEVEEPEPEPQEDEPFEEVDPHKRSEAVFADEEEWEEAEDDDDFSQRIKAVEIAEVDLGRAFRRSGEESDSADAEESPTGPQSDEDQS